MITEEVEQVVGCMTEKGRAVMTGKVEQGTEEVYMTTNEEWRNTLVGVHEMVEEHWSGEEVVMSKEVEQVSVDKKQVVEVNEMKEERWSIENYLGNEEVIVTEKVEQVAEEVFEQNAMVTGQLSMGNEEVVEVDETEVERWPLGEEDFLEYTKTIYDRWKTQGLGIANGKIREDDGDMWETKERCEARMEYEKAVRKFLTHTTQCSKCVLKKEEKTEIKKISNLIVIWFMVQFVHQLFISSVVKSGNLLRRARFIIKHSYKSVVTTSVFVCITSYVSITQTLQRFIIIIKQQHHLPAGKVPADKLTEGDDVDRHDQVPCPPVIVTSSGVTKQGLITRTWFFLEQSYHLIRVVTVKAYVSIKQTIIVIRRHTFREVLEEVNENSQGDVYVDRSTTVVVTPSGFSIHRLIRRTRLILQKTQGFLCRTKVVLVFSSVRDATIKAYISVKQTINRLLIKKPAVVTPLPAGSNDMIDSQVLVRRRLLFFSVVCLLLCLSGTLLFIVNREYHIAVTTKEDGSKSNKQVGNDGVIGKKDHVVAEKDHAVNEKKDDKTAAKKLDGKVDAKHEKDHAVNGKKDDKTAAKKSDGKVDAKHEKDHVVNGKKDDKTASKKSDGKADTKHEKDHVVNEKKDDKTASKKSDGKADTKHEKDPVVNEKKDDKTATKQSDGKVDAKHGKDHVVNEKKDDKTTTKQSDGKVDAKHGKGHVVNEKKDDKTTAKQSDGKVNAKHEKDHVVNEKKDDKMIAKQSDGKVNAKHEKDHVVNEKKDDKTAAKQSDGKVNAKHEKDHVVNEKKDDKTAAKQSDGKMDARKEVGDVVTEKGGDNAPVITEKFIRARISYVTTLVLNIHISTWSTIKQTYHRAFTWENKLVTDQRYGGMASNEVDVQEKDDVVRLLKTWISYAITLVQRGLQIEKVNLITRISVLSFVFLCVYVAIKNLRRTTINVGTTVIKGVTSGSLFVARTIAVSAGAFLWVTVNIPTRTWSVLYTRIVKAVTTSGHDGTEKKGSKVINEKGNEKVVDEKENGKAGAKHGEENENAGAKHGNNHVVGDKENENADGKGAGKEEGVTINTEKRGSKVINEKGNEKVVDEKENEKAGAKHGEENEKAGAKHGKNHVVGDKENENAAAKHGKGHVVDEKEKQNSTAKHGTDHVADEKENEVEDAKHGKGHVVNGKGAGKEEGVTINTDDNAVVKNEGLLIKSRISYVTTLVVNIHIRTWSIIKHTYHRVFTGGNDGHLVPDQGDGDIAPDNVSGHGNVVIMQIKYMISQVLKVHKWFVVEKVYHRILKLREQVFMTSDQEDDANVSTNQAVGNQRVTMWLLAKQTSYQSVVRIKLLLLGSWKTIHVITTRVQTGLLRIWSAIIKLERVLNIKVFGQATKKLLLWLRNLVSKEEILKSIVYGGLTEIMTSISIVAFFADFDTTILNVIAFALAGVIGGCFFFVTNIWGLKKEGGNTYTEQLGRINYFPFHATLAMLSFIIFGMIPPSTLVFSFLRTNDKKIAIWVATAVSLLCLSLLAIFKACVTSITYRFKYVKTVLWYHFITLGVSICSYLASKMVKGSIEDLGLFDTSTCDAMSRHN